MHCSDTTISPLTVEPLSRISFTYTDVLMVHKIKAELGGKGMEVPAELRDGGRNGAVSRRAGGV